MKNTFLNSVRCKFSVVLILTIGLTVTISCTKQSSPQPTPQQSNTTQPTPTNTVTTIDTTGKFKFYVWVQLSIIKTYNRDYVQDSNNVRFYNNADTIKRGNIFYSNRVDTGINRGISEIANFNQTFYYNFNVVPKPIWLAKGDSIVFEMDSIEYARGTITGFFTNNLYVFDARKSVTAMTPSTALTNIAINPYNTNTTSVYLGSGINLTNNQSLPNSVWISAKTRVKYVVPSTYH